MIIKLSPVRSDVQLSVIRSGDTLSINGVTLDFARLPDGATLPAEAVSSNFVIGAVERTAGDLVLTLMLPHAADASEAVRFPADIRPGDGPVHLPGQTPTDHQVTAGIIDWSQVVTAEAKDQAAAEALLIEVQTETAARRAAADAAIAPLQDAVDIDEATEAEAALLKEWKRYRVALNRLPDQPGYPAEIEWPASPA